MTASRSKAAIAWRYALAPACIAAAVLLRVSPLGPFFYPTEPFILGVLAAAWFGGVGPGVFAALLSAVTVPHLIELTQLPSADYRLLWGFFDLPRFTTLGLTGAAVGWGASSLRRTERSLRERERELSKTRDELETTVVERTAHLAASEERYARAMQASNDGIWEWNPATDDLFISERARQLWGLPEDVTVRTRSELKRLGRFHPADLQRIEEVIAASRLPSAQGFDLEYRVIGPADKVRWIRSQAKVFPGAEGQPALVTGSLTDITERKRAEEALRESQQRYERVMLASNPGIWDWDVVKDEFYVSPRFLEMGGLPPGTVFSGREDFMRRGPIHPEDREKWKEAVRQLFASDGSRLSMELRAIVEGETRWRRLEGICFRDATGRVVRWTGSTTDITERKQAEEALYESQKRYERVLGGANVGDWEWDVVNGHYFVSARMREMLEMPPELHFASREEFLAHVPFHPDDRETYVEQTKRAIAIAPPGMEYEYRVVQKGGAVRWMRVRGKPTRNAQGMVTHFSGSLADITERKHAEEALRRSEERFAMALAASSDGIWDWDLVTGQQFFSERAQRICGLEPGPTVRPHSEWNALRDFHPEDAPRRLAAIERHLAGETPVYEGEWRVRASGGGGEYRWMHTRGLCVRDAAGRPIRMVGALTDIDGRKRIEAALRKSEERYSLAMEATEEGHYDVNVDTGQLFTSERMNEIYGFAPGAQFEMRRDYLRQFRFYANDADTYHAAIAAAEAKGGPERYEFEYRILRPTGEMRWLRTRGKVTRDAEGRARRRTGVVADITEAKLAQEALLQSQERYGLAMEAAADGHTDWNLASGEFYISPRLLGILGYPPDTTFADRADWVRRFPFHPEDRKRWETAIAAHFTGREAKFKMDLRIVVRGETRWVAFTFIASRDPAGKPVRWTGTITDINDAKLAQEALRESQERYALAVAGSDDGLWDCDFTARRAFISARARELAGMPPGPEVVPLDEWFASLPLHPDDVPLRTVALHAHLSGEAPAYEGEFRLRQPDGAYRWRRLHGLCLRDAHGKPHRMAGSISDVDARRRAEEALRQSKEELQRLMESVSDYLWSAEVGVDGSYTYRYYSPVVERITGWRAEDLLASRERWVKLLHPLDRPRVDEIFRTLMSGATEQVEVEYRIVRPDGTLRWVRDSAHGTRADDGCILLHGVVSDITPRKLAEEALRASEERYSLAIEASDEGHFDTDLETGKMFVSARLNEIYGFPRQAKIVNRVEFLNQIPFHPDDRHVLDVILRPAWDGPEGDFIESAASDLYEFECRIIPRPGEIRWVHTRGKVTRDAEGRARRRVGVVADITDRKLADEALRLSEERYALAAAGTNDGIWDWDLLTNKMFVSERAQRIFGLEPGPTERLREEWHAMIGFHPDDHRAQRRMVEEYLSGERPTNEGDWRVQEKDGGYRWIRIRSMCLRNPAGEPVRMAGSVSDIDAQKKAEAALRLSEARYALAMEVAEEGHFDWNVQTDEIFASAQALRVFGVDVECRTRSDVMARVRYHPEDWPRISAEWREALAGRGVDHEFEYRILRAEEPRSIRGRWKIFRDANGVALRVIGIVADITDRKRAEEDLRESEQKYRTLFDSIDEGFCTIEVLFDENLKPTDYRFLQITPSFERQTGIKNAVGRRMREIAPQHEDHWFEIYGRIALTGEPMRFENEARQLGRWYDVYAFRVEDPKLRRVGILFNDITERKRAEGALRRSQHYLAEAQSLSHIGSWAFNADGFKYWSSELFKIHGLDPDGKAPSIPEYLALVHPEDRDFVVQEIERMLGGAPGFDFKKRIVRPDGEIRLVRCVGIRAATDGMLPEFVGSGMDVTEQERAEEALRKSEERFSLAVAGSNEGIFDWDLVSDRVYVSYRAQELFGLPRGELWRPRRDWRHILTFHPDDAPRLHDTIKAHIEGSTPTYDEEFRIILPGEGVRWFRQRGIALRDASGKAYRVVGSIGDVTERKQAVDTVRESESRFRTLVELNSGGFWEQDENLRYTPSAFAQDITGYPTDDRVGKTRWELSGNPTPLSCSWAEHQAILAARQPFRDFEYRRLRPDGEIGYYSASGAPIFDDQGRFKGYYGVANDITERKRFEEQLRSRQEMLELAQKSARAIAFEWKMGEGEGENRWSPDLEAMYGFEPGTYDGSFDTWKKLVHPADWPAVKEAILHAHRTGDVASEYRVVHPDGSVHWLQAKGRMLFDATGNATRMVGFMQDVTERKQAEEELRKMEQELRRAQRLEAMGTLAGGIAHDFNNILGAILGYGEMAMRDAKTGTRQRRDLDAIMAAGERGRALVDRILAFSRSGVGERIPVHVEDVVREALDQVAAKLPENVTIAPRLRAGRAAMLGDSTQVHQVVMNLVNNAVQAMPQGGMLRVLLDTLRVEAPRAALVGKLSPGEHIVLKVIDAGTGIRPEVLERMFDPFFTTKEVGVGSGLGLSLVHGIVANVGGGIEVATELGKGSIFTVYLPRSGDAPAKAADESRPLPRGEGERVLVVDDEEPLVRLATETLESLGYAPVGFTSSVNALQEFGANPSRFDAILTDERMPGVTGSAIIREVRRINPSIPILLMTGFVGGTAALKARELGANDVLKKPLLARELATSLARVLRP